MTRSPDRDGRALFSLIALGIANHVVLAGSRVTVSLDALAQGASPFTVGMLIALYALLPMIFAVAAGRFSDRVGVRRPMRLGAAGLVAGALLPAIAPGLPTLVVSAAVIGVSFMLFQVAAQQATGGFGTPADRARNFSLLAMGYSVSGFIGPLLAGITIDHGGFRIAFGVLALIPIGSSFVLANARLRWPYAGARPAQARTGGIAMLLREPTLRRALAINALIAMGWDLHTIFVPIYGKHLGLSASQIGAVLSTFAAATFIVRLCLPALARHLNEHQVLTLALFIAGAVYAAFPFSSTAVTLASLSFVLGLGLGSAQPMVMSLLHTHAPAGRIGEAVGVRMSLVQMSAVAVPLLFGAVGTSLGLTPVFWSVAVFLSAGGVLTRPR